MKLFTPLAILLISGNLYAQIPVNPGGGTGGSGTVTSFTAGTLPPLFTTNVDTPTATPALTFSLSNVAANSVWGNFTGSSTTPSYSATPVFSGAGLTALNASSLTTGTVAVGLLPIAGATTNGIVRADGSTIINSSGLGVLSVVGSALTGLNASNISSGTLAAARVPTLAVTGGTIDSTAIGQTTPANGAFLSLLSNAVNFGGGIINNVPIGATTAATGAFTTATANSFVGPLTGNVTGNVSGSAATAGTASALTCGTLLGDLPYFNTASTMACLPGSTTTAVKILSQTGNGTISAAPQWNTTTGTGSVVMSASPTLTGTVTAPTFSGALSGNATTATSATSSTSATTATNLAGGTTGGDLPYQSAAGTTSLVTGNITTTNKVLMQVGNATVSAAPVWTTPTGTGSPVLSISPTLTGMITTARLSLNQATGTAPMIITSTTPVANLTVSNHPTELYCGTTTTCSNTATTGGRVVFGSAAMVSGVAAVTGISPVFPDTNYACTASIKASGVTTELLTVANTSSSAITITSSSVTSTSTVSYICVR